MRTYLKSFLLEPTVLGLFVLLIGLSYFRITLHESSRRFAEEFQRQNFVELSNADILPLVSKLNALTATIPWVCIEAKSFGHVFFNLERGNCQAGLINEEVEVWSKPNRDISIRFILTFPQSLLNIGIFFLFTQIFMLALVIWSSKNIQLQKLRSKVLLSELAEQVSHDIRSPLSALEMFSNTILELPEEKRTILRNSINRIRDIANSLLLKNDGILESNEKMSFLSKQSEARSLISLASTIDSLLTEKRLQYRDRLNIQIEFKQTKDSYGLFISAQPAEFKRILSNLINNSIESFENERGCVEIGLASKNGLVEIMVKDNGKGIPESVLSKLGDRGATFGKKEGSGLGIYHATNTLKRWDGKLSISSEEKIGTRVSIVLYKVDAPEWFISALRFESNSSVIVCDEDSLIHQVWSSRVQEAGGFEKGIKLLGFGNAIELKKFYGEKFVDLDSAVFLIDYEISNHHRETGLDLIEQLGIQHQSILITSRYEDVRIQERCKKNGIKIIPKIMSGFISIEFVD